MRRVAELGSLDGSAMTTIKKISVGVGLLILLVSIVVLLPSCMTPVVSRVAVPGSSMTAVVTADLAGCYDVDLFENGQAIPDARQCLGPYVSQRCSVALVSATSNIVTIIWADSGRRYSTAVDIVARRFVTYTNGAAVR